jgi:hypothetical protein
MSEPSDIVDFATAGEPLRGHERSGDRAVCAAFAGGVLVALIDGIGHGNDAADAAELAAGELAAGAGAAVDELMARCHARLYKTRGAAITLVSIAARGELVWVGVGNVDAVVVRAPSAGKDESIATRGGAVGFQLPALAARSLAIGVGDTLVLATDGIRHSFREEVRIDRAPDAIARAIVDRHATGGDDACVAVARFIGTARGARA